MRLDSGFCGEKLHNFHRNMLKTFFKQQPNLLYMKSLYFAIDSPEYFIVIIHSVFFLFLLNLLQCYD